MHSHPGQNRDEKISKSFSWSLVERPFTLTNTLFPTDFAHKNQILSEFFSRLFPGKSVASRIGGFIDLSLFPDEIAPMMIQNSYMAMDDQVGVCRSPIRQELETPDAVRTFAPSALLAVFCACSWPYAQAHETIPPEWCMDPKSTPLIVSTSVWTSKGLFEFQNKIGLPSKDCSSGQTCGMVDEWHYANLAAESSCPETVIIDSMTMQPQAVVTAPVEFNSINHHSDYQFIDGDLQIACVVCVPASGKRSNP